MIADYARVSTADQDLAIQEAALRTAGCDVVRAEKRSGASREGRAELATLLDFLRSCDALVVTRVDHRRGLMRDKPVQEALKELRGIKDAEVRTFKPDEVTRLLKAVDARPPR